jgi:hypothetical protein
MLSCLPKVGTGNIGVVFGNGLSNLPYEEYKKFLDRVGDRTKAANEQWNFLEEKIRKPSLDVYNNSYAGYLYLATLVKENIVNPIITTNWDCIFERIMRLPKFNTRLLLNPCCQLEKLDTYDGYKTLAYEKLGVDNCKSSKRLWKIHGSINYAFLSCCSTLTKISPVMPFPRNVLFHVSCYKEGKLSLRHHILEPRSPALGFEEEIAGAVDDLFGRDNRSNVSIVLALGFSGWDYEEIVKSIIELSLSGKAKVFYVNECRWSGEEPLLFTELKKNDKQIIRESANKVLEEIVKYYGLFDKYAPEYSYYLKV